MGEKDANLNTKGGSRIILLPLPAIIDVKIAPLELYTLIMPLYFHFKFPDRENPEKMTFTIDVRRFKGGQNNILGDAFFVFTCTCKWLEGLLGEIVIERLKKMRTLE